jgi:hypothetical protein
VEASRQAGLLGADVPEVQPVVFKRKPPTDEAARHEMQSDLVEKLLEADDVERKRLLLVALQTGQVKKSETADLLRLVERLSSVSGRHPQS